MHLMFFKRYLRLITQRFVVSYTACPNEISEIRKKLMLHGCIRRSFEISNNWWIRIFLQKKVIYGDI